MKYLNDYIDTEINQAMRKAGAFYCFSDKQFNERRKENVKYVNLGAGLVCPKNKVNEFLNQLDHIIKNGIKKDIQDNGIDNIILRELNNNEAFYTGDIEDTVNALKDYPITTDQIEAIFKKNITC